MMGHTTLHRGLLGIARIGADPEDSEEARLEKTLLVFSSLMMASMAVFWGAVYAALGGLMPQIHALALHTHTPAEWDADASVPESPRCRGGSKHDPRPA